MSPPENILKQLAGLSDIFVETGTYYGDTSILAMKCGFKEVHTIEIYRPAYEIACKRCSGFPINLSYGDSGDILIRILEQLTKPAVIFLDAHAVPGLEDSSGMGIERSPLVREMAYIANSPHRHIVAIDDVDFLGTEVLSGVTMQNINTFFPSYSIKTVDGVRPMSIMLAIP